MALAQARYLGLRGHQKSFLMIFLC